MSNEGTQPTYHNFDAKVEGSIVGEEPKNIAGPGKAACVVFTVSSKWQSKVDSNITYHKFKALGKQAEEILNSPLYERGKRVIVDGVMEESREFYKTMEAEDGSKVKVRVREPEYLVTRISPSYRFDNDGDGGNRNFNNNFNNNSSNSSGGSTTAAKGTERSKLF